MNEILDKASSHFTAKSIAETSTEELEKVAHEHPYFSAAQVILSKKYQAENHPGFLSQVQKTALYFNNPYWLHFQLLDKKLDFSFAETKLENAIALEPINEADEKKNVSPDNLEKHKQERIFSKDEIFAASTLARETLSTEQQTEVEPEDETLEITPDELHPEKEEILEEIQEEEVDQKDIQEEETKIEVEKLAEEESTPPVEKYISASLDVEKIQPTNEQPDDHLNTETTNDETVEADPQKLHIEEPLVEKDLIETVVEENIVAPTPIDQALEENATVSAKATEQQPVVDEKSLAPVAPSTNAEPLIPIEPYYTVDYFASQGIKLVLDKNPQDKLGKQLRSFTDWLKHMKKLGPEDALKSTHDTNVDPAVKKIADTPNNQKEILTEAMADVLIKQGKTEQAIELYNKLSFLNPDKSSYFANQIQKLKGS